MNTISHVKRDLADGVDRHLWQVVVLESTGGIPQPEEDTKIALKIMAAIDRSRGFSIRR